MAMLSGNASVAMIWTARRIDAGSSGSKPRWQPQRISPANNAVPSCTVCWITALESVEHLTLEKLQEESGDRYIWDALNERYPDKQQHDWLAECLREVFQISANEGESMMAWTSRVQEVFSKCKRKVQVDFPTEARGWICLHAAGLTEDQRAIVTAKTQGDMKLDVVMGAMRFLLPRLQSSFQDREVPRFSSLCGRGRSSEPEV